jgi:diguanylate cyclase (GGDEF)-like protein/putative nucleotidyltransferase with HDIG domain
MSAVMSRFVSLPAKARLYVVAVIACGAAALAAAGVQSRFAQPGLFAVLLLISIVAATAKIELPLGRSQSNLSLSQATIFWALLTLDWTQVVAIAAVSACAQCTLRTPVRNPVHRTLFSIASIVLTAAVVAVPVRVLSADVASIGSLVRAAAVVAPLYFFVNTGLVAGAIALSTRQSAVSVWHRNFLWSAPNYLAGAGLAAVAAAGSSRGWFGWLAVLAVPGYLVFRSYHTWVLRLREEQAETRRAMDVQLATVEALALAIEAKAGCTPEHIRSIQQCAASLAEACGLSDEDVQAVRTAALLHDVGNMAVPEHILAKPGTLTPEEFERIKIHPRVGADILRNVPFGAPVGEMVLHHHERWDGLGYPAGLQGDEIPIGARILAIADCFSTLQTDRPYRPARSEAEALATVREYAGTAYDPTLVEVFFRRRTAPAMDADAIDAAAWTTLEPEREGALENIAGAHREEQTLYEIAQALGSSLSVRDAMSLIDEKVSRLVPFVTCALFLGDDAAGYVCRYGHGPGTEALLKWEPRSWSEIALRLPSCADGRGAHGDELQTVLACPLTHEGRSIGAMVIYHTSPASFTDEHRRVLGRVSEQAAAVIFNATRFEQTQQESHTDPLTDLPNRRSLDREFEKGLAGAKHNGAAASLIVLDLDRLKEINDTYGHEAGDRAIRGVASVLRATVRQHDLCARFAGDEFIVVLWGCDHEREARRVRDLQAAVAAFPFEPRSGVTMSLSISAGAARCPEDGETFDELLAAADERMYRDKATRRSRNAGRHAADKERVGTA